MFAILKARHIVIIGAGPAGLMAAEVIANAGHKVTVYDRMPSVGRKLLMAGRGGLNLTHSEPLERFLTRYGAAESWLAPHIQAFTPMGLREWVEGLGQELFVGSSGRVFPKVMKAAPLLRAWLKRLSELGVEFKMQHRWNGWQGDALHFTHADETVLVKSDATLLALGGASWPRLGSDGGWVNVLADKGVEIAPLRPSNCGFVAPWSAHFSERFAGSPIKPVTLTHNGKSHQGEIMVTADGLEGGAMYALSASMREAIIAQGSTEVFLDLRPTMLQEALQKKLGARGSKSLSTYLRNAGFSPVAIGLLREVIPQDLFSKASASELAQWLKALPVKLTATKGLDRAISSAGGIERKALDEQFMLCKLPGVFATGEMLDWEAPTGGYLLQACFSTAVAAAEGLLEWLENEV